MNRNDIDPFDAYDTSKRRSASSHGSGWTSVVVGLLALGAAFASWWWLRRPEAAAPAVTPVAAAPAAAGDVAPPLPPLAERDALMLRALRSLSSSPEYARWLLAD